MIEVTNDALRVLPLQDFEKDKLAAMAVELLYVGKWKGQIEKAAGQGLSELRLEVEEEEDDDDQDFRNRCRRTAQMLFQRNGYLASLQCVDSDCYVICACCTVYVNWHPESKIPEEQRKLLVPR